jgi:hypothetical protein
MLGRTKENKMSNQELLSERRERSWERVTETAPAWVRDRIIAFRSSVLAGLEFRMSTQQVREAETRSALAAKALRFVKRVFRTEVSEDAELRLQAARQADEIRQSAIRDKGCTAVRLGSDGKFYRDYEAENRRKERIASLMEQIHEAAGEIL